MAASAAVPPAPPFPMPPLPLRCSTAPSVPAWRWKEGSRCQRPLQTPQRRRSEAYAVSSESEPRASHSTRGPLRRWGRCVRPGTAQLAGATAPPLPSRQRWSGGVARVACLPRRPHHRAKGSAPRRRRRSLSSTAAPACGGVRCAGPSGCRSGQGLMPAIGGRQQ